MDLARELQVTQQTVARWESGDVPQRRLHVEIANFLGLDLDSFYSLIDDAPTVNVVRLHPPETFYAPQPTTAVTPEQERLLDALVERLRIAPLRNEEMEFYRRVGAAIGLSL